MLPSKNRLSPSQIRRVLRSGRRTGKHPLQMTYLPNSVGTARLAFIVPVAFDRHATARNRMKRLLRESAHRLLPELPAVDVVVRVQAKMSDDTQQSTERTLREILTGAKLL